MIIETLKALLGDQATIAEDFGDRIYPVTAPDAAPYPHMILTKVDGPASYDMAGDANLERARVQLDIKGDAGAADVNRMKAKVKAFLSGYRGGASSSQPCHIQGAFCINDFDSTEPKTERAGPRVRRRTLEFQIWSQEV